MRAGFRVVAFDAFQDVETRRLAEYGVRIPYADGGFDAGALLAALDTVAPAGGCVLYGSGLEHNPQLLGTISRRFQLVGNTPETVASAKCPRRFFPLLETLGIAHPETRFHPPNQPAGWLSKRAGGSGGTHVRHCDGTVADYYQREVSGRPVSVLFLADGAHAVVVGFNEQWLAPTHGMPFRYGGAVGNAELPASAKNTMAQAVARITAAIGLRGLNSMDFVLDGEVPLALEVNPRLSASFDLYDIPNLLECHLQACRGSIPALSAKTEEARAHHVVYAPAPLIVDEALDWPAWTVDIPLPGTLIPPGAPVCTVHASGPSAEVAKARVFARVRQLEAQLQEFFA
ncbi:MAG: ATP-grasp domain-containing protein [Methylophilaceae bacterium]|nr:ATP-grasp domain-containing protein [Methylophilaceae bacterium]